MGLTKTEINLRRLLAAMPNQTNHAKLAQYLVTLKEQLALLTGETGQGNLPCISEEKAKEYAEQIETAASRINVAGLDKWGMLASEAVHLGNVPKPREDLLLPADSSQDIITTSKGIRRRVLLDASNKKSADSSRWKNEANVSTSVKADSGTLELIGKHRNLQEDLTDEMVVLARRIKEASLSMNHAVLDSQKVLDSAEQAVEGSLAATNHVNQRAHEIFSLSYKTGCWTWLIIFAMSLMFLLMVFLIRIT